MNWFLLLERERRLLSHLCQICLALLKIQQFWKYHAISGRKYSTVPENMNLFLLLEEGFCLIYVRFVLLYWKHSSFENITLFQEANILLFQKTLTYFYYKKKAFVPFISDLSCFTESTAVLKISSYFRRQISYCFQKTWSYLYYWKEKEGFCPIYVRFFLLYWKYCSFKNITLFQEANILLFQKHGLIFIIRTSLLSHLCQICIALLK